MDAQTQPRNVTWTFPALLRTSRAGHGWTQARLAAAVGVAIATVGRWERGESVPQGHLLPALAHVLGIDEDRLRLSIRQPDSDLAEVVPLHDLGAPADVGPRSKTDTSAREEDFLAAVIGGLLRGDGTDPTWSQNVANTARLLDLPWDTVAPAGGHARR
jgi:transcriptional regulator with XRE-family HTH domain